MAVSHSQQQNPDNSLAMLWGVLFIFAVIGLIWFFFHDYIVAYILWVRWIEARLISFFFPTVRSWVAYLEAAQPQHCSFSDISIISNMLGYYLRFPVGIILFVFGLFIYQTRANLRFSRYYSMQMLSELEQHNWAQISPIIGLDLVNTPIDTGPFAMALTPFQFAKAHHLLELREVIPTTTSSVTILEDRYMEAKLKRNAAQRTFSMQLGQLWEGAAPLPMPTKALFAIFAARRLRDRVAADHLLEQISKSALSRFSKHSCRQLPTLHFEGTENLIRKYEAHPLIQMVTQQHAYVLGVMASMLVLAREDGVLASAEFLWLKPYDRQLWFMLNCIGRQTAYTEVAGAFSHWVAEQAAGCKLRVPMVDMAVEALEIALHEVHLNDEAGG